MGYYKLESKLLTYDISSEILKNFGTEKPIIVCLGSDKVLSDMVGVLVADLLKKRNLNIVVFGGTKRCINKTDAMFIAKNLDPSRLLFIDSGILQTENTIAVVPYLIINNGRVINSTTIIGGTIKKQNKKICLANVCFNDLQKYVNAIADSISEYISYVQILKSKNYH